MVIWVTNDVSFSQQKVYSCIPANAHIQDEVALPPRRWKLWMTSTCEGGNTCANLYWARVTCTRQNLASGVRH